MSNLGYTATLRKTRRGNEVKLVAENGSSLVKVEVNCVFRGTVLPIVRRELTSSAQEMFTSDLEVPMLDVPELYGGKLVAAMDRQHPRDYFDVAQMYDRFGLSRSFVDCFVAYLAGHNRPVHEVLFPRPKPLEALYTSEFIGMTRVDIPLGALLETRSRLQRELPTALTANHRAFLLSMVKGEPNWDRMPFPHLRELPAIRWKLVNLQKLEQRNQRVFEEQFNALETAFASH